MNSLEQLRRYRIALKELGPRPVFENLLYRFGLFSGHYRRSLQASLTANRSISTDFVPVFQPAHPDRLDMLLAEADLSDAELIVSGQYRPFGTGPRPLDLSAGASPLDWTAWRSPPGQDVKDLWEPGRFGWAVELARAYRATRDVRYAQAFWHQYEFFTLAQPPYTGPYWSSAQEVALRLIHLCFAAGEFIHSPACTPQRMLSLTRSLAYHAGRIPPTMVYASSQQNNHLLSEAVGLITAARFLPEHPQARRWLKLGWREFERGILSQVASDGTYGQQSVCYHRLMLTLALWLNSIRDREFSPPVLQKLAASANWLTEMTRGMRGLAPNLGSNDGSLILPLGLPSVDDYAAVASAARIAFCAAPLDTSTEFSAWLAAPQRGQPLALPPIQSIRRLEAPSSIGFLRTADFFTRPSHADQLHFDLWYRGMNILRDPGTYRYNLAAPWQNGLAGSDVHNTVTVDGFDQMTRLGKFLWVDRARVENGSTSEKLAARHFGYQKLGIIHERQVTCSSSDEWQVIDRLHPFGSPVSPHLFRLHWLLPDALPEKEWKNATGWVWRMNASTLRLFSSLGEIQLSITTNHLTVRPEFCLFRQGLSVYGDQPANPVWGWYSPTYTVLQPALALAVYVRATAPLTFTTRISFLPAGGKASD